MSKRIIYLPNVSFPGNKTIFEIILRIPRYAFDKHSNLPPKITSTRVFLSRQHWLVGEYQYFIYIRVKAVIIAVWNATPATRNPPCVHFIEKLFNFDPFPSSVPIETSVYTYIYIKQRFAFTDFKRIVRDAFKSDIKRFV